VTGGSSGICKVVARFTDGRVLKGTIQDFAPNRPLFHLITDDPGAASVKIPVGALKALFFVKDFAGNPNRKDRNEFPDRPVQARRLVVHFADGEKLAGTTTAFAPGCPGFFVVPADPEGNNERVFVVRSAVKRIEWVQGVPAGVARTV
jgi:hypothetical protein